MSEVRIRDLARDDRAAPSGAARFRLLQAKPARAALSQRDYLLGTWRELDVPDGWRAEIIDDNGVVLVAPPSDPRNHIAVRVNRMPGQVPPDGWDVYQPLGIQLQTVERLYMPDLVVLPEDVVLDPSRTPCPADQVSAPTSGPPEDAGGGPRVFQPAPCQARHRSA
ncbi:hypothetical protein [Nocardiopsis alborubida]|uniref:hypothetical protein n=1 Tax=Nocardiopsis alborubida TaxID=146802 RepID=UPI001E5CFA62|nr:hypothetical protein [Nocardiopsis alborubida]